MDPELKKRGAMPSHIATVILSLLHEHDCVIVPGLGAFLTRRTASTFDARRGLMLPPSKEVAFNADIRRSDGLLADGVAGADGVDYTEAMRRVEEFAADALRRVAAGEVVLLPRLGSLSGVGGRVVFEAVPGLNVLVDSYGLAPVAARPVRSAALLGPGLGASLRRVAASAAAVAALMLVSQTAGDGDMVRADMSALLAPSVPVSAIPVAFRADVAAEAAEDVAGAETGPALGRFFVVVASFPTRQEARDYAASMRAGGVEGLALLDCDGRCRVVAASSDDEAEAKDAARALRKRAGFEKCWVFDAGL